MLVCLIVLKWNRAEVAKLGKTLLHNFAGDVNATHHTRALNALVKVEISGKTKTCLNVLLNSVKGEVLDEPTWLAAVYVGHAVVVFLVEVQNLWLIFTQVLQAFFQNLAIATKFCILASWCPFKDFGVRYIQIDDVAGNHSALGHQSSLAACLREVFKYPTSFAAIATLQSFA